LPRPLPRTLAQGGAHPLGRVGHGVSSRAGAVIHPRSLAVDLQFRRSSAGPRPRFRPFVSLSGPNPDHLGHQSGPRLHQRDQP
jgi:hypothetical protein